MNIWKILAALKGLIWKPTKPVEHNVIPQQELPVVEDLNRTPNPDNPEPVVQIVEPARLATQQIIKAKLDFNEAPRVFDRTQELRLFSYLDKVLLPQSDFGVRPSLDELTAIRSLFQESKETDVTEPLVIDLCRMTRSSKLNVLFNALFAHELDFLWQIEAIGKQPGEVTRGTMQDVFQIANKYADVKSGQKVYLIFNNSIDNRNCIFELSTNLFYALHRVGDGKGLGGWGRRLKEESPSAYADYVRDEYHLWRSSNTPPPRHPHGNAARDPYTHDILTGKRISYSLKDLADFIGFQTSSDRIPAVTAYLTNEAAANILLRNEKHTDDLIPDPEKITINEFRDLMDEYN